MVVKVFRSTDFGAPLNTNAAGALIAILDACLVNGYGAQTNTATTALSATITSAAGVATVTAGTHGYQTGMSITIVGATQTDYNGVFLITVTSATTFTYAVPNAPVSPATGTITAKSTALSITQSGNVATVTTTFLHGLATGTFMRISGASQAAYNGDFPITVTGATTFTYAVTGSPASPATGTITSKVAPADWTKPFSGVNVAAYKMGVGSNGMYLRIDDSIVASYTAQPKAKAFVTMSDINSGTLQFPTEAQVSGGRGFHKNSGVSPLPWLIIVKPEGMFAVINSSYSNVLHIFSDFTSYKAGDSFNTFLALPSANSIIDQGALLSASVGLLTVAGHYLPTAHTQTGTSIVCGKVTTLGGTMPGTTGMIPTYPSLIDGALHLSPYTITEPAGLRGKLPCLWNILHTMPFTDGDIVNGTGDLAGKKFIAFTGYNNSQALLEISSTW